MSKLVDKERLAKLAAALDARAKAAVQTEKERAMAAEQAVDGKAEANAAAIAAINNGETGILKQAKDYVDEREDVLQGNIDAKVAQSDYDVKMETLDAEDERIAGLVEAEVTKAREEEGKLQAAINVINGEADGSIKKAVADEAVLREAADTKIREDFAAADSALDTALKAKIESDIAVEKARAEGEEGKIRAEFAAADTALHTTISAEIDADVKVEKERAEGQEAAIRQEMADEAARVNQKIADDIAAESTLRQAEEAAIRGEFAAADAALKTALQKEIDDDVKVEKDRAEAKEAELLAAINKEVEDREQAVQDLADRHDEEMEAAAEQVGKDLAALKAELQGEIDADVAAEAKLREDADKALDERVKPLEAHVAAQPGVDAEQDRRIKALEDDAPVKQAAIEAAQAAADAAQDAADAAQADVDAVEQRLDVEGGLVDRIEANEANIARLDGAVDVEGSVKKQIKDAIDEVNGAADALEDRVEALETFKDTTYPAAEAKVREDFAAADAQVLADAKKYADEEITKLVDSAPEAMNTLNELATAINANKGVYDAYVEQHAQAMATMKSDLQKEIDDDVKAVVDAQKLVNDAQAETNADFEGRIAANEAFVKGHSHDGLQGEIDAVEGRADALEAFVEDHDHSVMEKGISDNAAAIEAEVKEGGARDAAIAAALEAYANEAEVKAMLTNVINSLGLAIVENKLQLTLGTSDFVIKEVELDMATDADIDAIIAGLDTPAAE